MWLPQELQVILLKFPGSGAKIIQLYNHDSNFKSLCEDYWLSTTLLARQRGSIGADIAMENEYKSIRALLETEVEAYLDKN